MNTSPCLSQTAQQPTQSNRRAFASDLYREARQEFPDCQVYANGFEYRTFVMQRVGDNLFAAVQLERFVNLLLAIGFRRVVCTSEDGRVFKTNLQ
jgi:hypothetical protein